MSRTHVVLAAALVASAAIAIAPPLNAGAGTGDETALVELGRRLFFDPVLGRQGRIGCSSCHDPEHGFSDPRRLSEDETGTLPRHSQPLTDLAGEGFHWDGEFDTVRAVVDARIEPVAEAFRAMAERAADRLAAARAKSPPDREAVAAAVLRIGSVSPSYYGEQRFTPATPAGAAAPTVVARLGAAGAYARGFAAAFGDTEPTSRRIGDALDAYVCSLRSTENSLDRWELGEDSLSAEAKRGLSLFRGKAGCADCHLIEGARPLLTDGRFHNTGVETSRVHASARDGRIPAADPGRLGASFDRADRQAFKTPSLRDVARRAPYFHDGSAPTLSDVVRYYDQGGARGLASAADPRIRPLGLTESDRADLVAFLESLSGRERAGLGTRPGRMPLQMRIVAENLDGTRRPDLELVIRPRGDRLAPAAAMPGPARVRTGNAGVAWADVPLATHFVIETPEGLALTDLLPDWTSDVLVIHVPQETVAADVRLPRGWTELPPRLTLGAEPRVFTLIRARPSGSGIYVLSATAPGAGDGPSVWIADHEPRDYRPGRLVPADTSLALSRIDALPRKSREAAAEAAERFVKAAQSVR